MKPDQYVLGFLFSPDDSQLVLIEKRRPDWAKGKWNGVGGKVDNGENIFDAMAREFQEETGFWNPPSLWREFGTMTGPGWEVHMFESQAYSLDQAVNTMTDERVAVCDVCTVRLMPLVQSLIWIIPLALDRTKIYSNIIATPNLEKVKK